MSVAPNSGIIDFSTFTPPSGGQDGIQGQVPKPLAGQGGYVLTGSGWSSLGALGVISYQGTWNAATNTPTIVSGVGTQGYYYVVSVAGTTTIDGISNWGVGDWIIFNGSTWQKIEGGSQGNFTTLDVTGLATLATVDINGGTIDNTAIGSTTASTGVFTQLTAQQVAVRGGVNLLLRSQEFNSWSEANAVSVTANSIAAPDGTTTADTITADGTSAGHFLGSNTLTVSGTNTFSVYLKAGTSNYAQLLYAGDTTSFINFDLTPGAGAVGTSGGTVTGAIVDIGNGWYRCIAINTATTVTRARICIVNSSSATRAQTLTISTTIYAWGAQLEPGAVANTYIPTTSSAITIENKLQVTGQAAIEGNAVAQDVIVQGGNNLLLRSQEFSNASWTKRGTATVTADADTAPDGTLTADLVSGLGTNGANDMFQGGVFASTGVSLTPSVYIKKVSSTGTLRIESPNGSANGRLSVDLSLLGSGWERITPTHPAVTVTTAFNGTGATSNGLIFFNTSGTLSFYIWGAQLELGTVASPYTPTTSAAVTTTNDILVPSGQIQTALGSASLPSYSILGDTNTGLFSPAADNISISVGGTEAVRVNSETKTAFGIATLSGSQTARVDVIGRFDELPFRVLRHATYGEVIRIGRNGVTETASINYPADGVFAINTNGSERMRIDSSGNLGLGISNPNQRLQIVGTTSTIYAQLVTTTASNAMRFTNSGGDLYFGIDDSTGGNFATGTAYGRSIFSTGAYPLAFYLNGAERMRITSTGNVGIGDSNPLDALVVASGRLRVSSTNKLAFGSNQGGYADIGVTGSTTGTMVFRTWDGSAYTERLRLIHSASTIVFGNGETSATPNNTLLQATGGDGTNITGATLTIQGGRGTGTGAGGPIVFQTAAAGGVSGTSLNAATERMRITPTGSIGIGRSIPTFYSANATTVSLDGTSGSYVDFYFNGTRTGLIYSENTRFILDTVGSVPMIARTNLTERLRILSGSATVVIGNGETDATPSNGTLQATGGSGTNITGATLTIQGGRGTGTGAGGPIIFSTSAAGASGSSLNAATERARIDSNGNLLVGTTTNTNSSRIVSSGTISETVSSTQYLVASQYDVGTAANQIPLNQYLGALAYENTETPALDVGTGITTGTGTICKANGGLLGGIYQMTILIDLTGLNSGGTAGDIIGVNGTALPCYIARLPAMTVLGGRMTCLETPAGGDTDIDLYSATEGTGVEDQAITALTETEIINAGAQTRGTVTYFSADPAANAYFYFVGQGTANATYTAGRFLIEIFGVQ